MEGQRKFWWGIAAIAGITLLGLFGNLDSAAALGGILAIFGVGVPANLLEHKMTAKTP